MSEYNIVAVEQQHTAVVKATVKFADLPNADAPRAPRSQACYPS
jgi:hypothetical protein